MHINKNKNKESKATSVCRKKPLTLCQCIFIVNTVKRRSKCVISCIIVTYCSEKYKYIFIFIYIVNDSNYEGNTKHLNNLIRHKYWLVVNRRYLQSVIKAGKLY